VCHELSLNILFLFCSIFLMCCSTGMQGATAQPSHTEHKA